MLGRQHGVVGVVLWLVLCCGGRVDSTQEGAESAGREGVSGGPASAGAASSSAGAPTTPSAGKAGATAPDAGTEPPPPECPELEGPLPRAECDPLQPLTSCPPGLGCYPFVEHPLGDCGTQTFGARCRLPGTGAQGDACGELTAGCSPGHVCVLGSHPGRRCAKLCSFTASSDCPAGMICEPTDVAGYGVCG